MVKRKELLERLIELQQWFEDNPKLPAQIDPQLLKRFLKCMYYDVEETKKLIELNYTLRNKSPQIFVNRDPEEASTQKTLGVCDMVPLPGLTPERNKVLMYRLVDYDASKLNSLEESKVFFMTTDCLFTMEDAPPRSDNRSLEDNNENDEDEARFDELADGEVQVVDVKGYSMGHMARISFMTVRSYMKYLQEAYPLRLRQMHIVNCPSFLDKMIAILKPFIHDDVYKLIHFHTSGIETLYDYVPKDMLPEEYGGKAGKMSDMKNEWRRILHEKRNYLMDPAQWKIEKTETRGRWYWF